MTAKPDIVIIGPGTVGTTLAILAAKAGYRVAAMGGRNADSLQAAAEVVGTTIRRGPPDEVAGLGGLVLLTVPDDAIAPLCRDLAAGHAFAPGAVVAHCSGALASDVLSPARGNGCHVASLHPLQTFPSVEAGLRKFAGTYCFCEGDPYGLAVVEKLAADLGGRPVRMNAQGKLLYHAAAVFASNYFVGLVDAAVASAGHAGIAQADALAALAPLVKATAENVFAEGPEEALTGPIARGDAGLVARQYHDVTAADPRLGELYRLLGLWTIDLALRKGSIDKPKAQELRRALG